jgi:hypothetical protein
MVSSGLEILIPNDHGHTFRSVEINMGILQDGQDKVADMKAANDGW